MVRGGLKDRAREVVLCRKDLRRFDRTKGRSGGNEAEESMTGSRGIDDSARIVTEMVDFASTRPEGISQVQQLCEYFSLTSLQLLDCDSQLLGSSVMLETELTI